MGCFEMSRHTRSMTNSTPLCRFWDNNYAELLQLIELVLNDDGAGFTRDIYAALPLIVLTCEDLEQAASDWINP